MELLLVILGCELQHLPDFGAMSMLDTPQADDPLLQKLRARVSAALAGWEDVKKMWRRSRGAAAPPLLGSGFNYLPAKLEQGFMLGKSLSNFEDLIGMENAPERGVCSHRLQVPSADLREERSGAHGEGTAGRGRPRLFWKGASSTFGNAEGNESCVHGLLRGRG